MHLLVSKNSREYELAKIRKLVGNATPEHLRYVDCFIGEEVGLFMPVGGQCYYGLVPKHTHPSYMFTLSFNEKAAIDIEGKIIQGLPGKVTAVSPDVAHHELPSDYAPRYIATFIKKEFFEGQIACYPAIEMKIFRGDLFGAPPLLLSLLKRFMIEADHKAPGREAVLHGLSLEICHCIIRAIFDFAPANDTVSSRIEIDRVIEYMHSHLDRKLTVTDMAEIAHMSSSNFSRAFCKETGMTPGEYLTGVRMDMAKRLLLAGDKTITAIAAECGFGSPAYLASSFRKRYKSTPSEYQNRFKSSAASPNSSQLKP